MLSVARDTVKARWHSLFAAFLGLALGVTVVASMSAVLFSAVDPPAAQPERFGSAPVVVRALEETPAGSVKLVTTQPMALPAGLVAQVAAVAPVVTDRSFYAQFAGRPGSGTAPPVGHPWPVAGFGGYRIESGRAPARDDEVVVTSSSGLRPGMTARVTTAEGTRSYQVVAVTGDADFETAVFFTDTEAARLSPKVSALVADGPADRIRQVVGDRAEVLTGDDRAQADPDPERRSDALIGVVSMTATAIGIALSVVVFVVASTFAYGITRRRREFGLLRAVGATPEQVRRMVFGEAIVLASVASVIGAVLGLALAPLLAAGLRGSGVAPDWFSVTSWVLPVLTSVLLGLGVSLLAVWSAARRASRVRPAEALRDAAVDTRTISRGRLWAGLLLLFGGFALAGFVAYAASWVATIPLLYTPVVMVPVIGAAVLAPVVVKPLTWVLTWPLSWFRGASGMLVRDNTLAAVRRTATSAGPLLLMVGLSISLLGTSFTSDQAQLSGLRSMVRAEYVALPGAAPVLDHATADRLRAQPGARVVTSTPITIYHADTEVYPDEELYGVPALAVDPAGITGALNPPLAAGTMDGFGDDTIVVDEDWGFAVGDRIDVWLADGQKKTLRVSALLKGGALDAEALVSSTYAGDALPTMAYVSSSKPGVSAGAVVQPTKDWVAESDPSQSESVWFGMLMTLAIIAVYCAMSIASTLVMATAGQRGSFRTLRLTGATKGQVLRMVAGESVVIAAVGLVPAVLISIVNLLGLKLVLEPLVGSTPVVVPWLTVTLIAAGSVLLMMIASLLPARFALRGRVLAGIPE